MSYFRTDLGGFTAEQEKAIFEVSPEEIRTLTPSERMDLALRHREARAAESSAKWGAVGNFATAIIPLAAFFGVSSLFKIGRE